MSTMGVWLVAAWTAVTTVGLLLAFGTTGWWHWIGVVWLGLLVGGTGMLTTGMAAHVCAKTPTRMNPAPGD